jgi:hypothetical protein
MRAAGNGQTATVTELVRLGADINAQDIVRACEGTEFGRRILADCGRCACCRMAGLRSRASAARRKAPSRPTSSSFCGFVRASIRCVRVKELSLVDSSWLTAGAVRAAGWRDRPHACC